MDHDKVRWVYCQAHNRIYSAQPGLSTPTPTYVLIFSMDPSWKWKSLQKGATLSLLGWTPLTASQSRHTIDSLTAACLSLSYQKVSNNWLLGPSSTIMGLPIGITTPFIAGPTLWFQSLLTTWRVFLPAIGPWPHYQCVGSFSVLDKTGVVFLFLWLGPRCPTTTTINLCSYGPTSPMGHSQPGPSLRTISDAPIVPVTLGPLRLWKLIRHSASLDTR